MALWWRTLCLREDTVPTDIMCDVGIPVDSQGCGDPVNSRVEQFPVPPEHNKIEGGNADRVYLDSEREEVGVL